MVMKKVRITEDIRQAVIKLVGCDPSAIYDDVALALLGAKMVISVSDDDGRKTERHAGFADVCETGTEPKILLNAWRVDDVRHIHALCDLILKGLEDE